MSNDELTRRDFVTMTVAAGLAAAAGSDVEAQRVVERTSTSRRPTARRRSVHSPRERRSSGGDHLAGCVRPAAVVRNMAKRLAAAGYSVLMRIRYQVAEITQCSEDASKVDFRRSGRILPLMASIAADGTVEGDAPACVAWLDMQKRSIAARRSERKATAWAARSSSEPPRRCRGASARRVLSWRQSHDRPPG